MTQRIADGEITRLRADLAKGLRQSVCFPWPRVYLLLSGVPNDLTPLQHLHALRSSRTLRGKLQEADKMTDEKKSQLVTLAIECTRAILEGQDTVTVSKDGPKRVPGFPRGELLSIGTNGAHNYAVCPLKVLAWIYSGTKGGRIMERTAEQAIK